MLSIKSVMIGLGAAIVTGGALLGGSNAIKEEINEKKAADEFEKRSLERHDGYAVAIKARKFGKPKLTVEKAIYDGNGKMIEGGDK